MSQGTIKKVIADKGFGFIEGERGDLFFHHSAVEGTSIEALQIGQRVSYEEGRGPKGARRERQAGVTPPLTAGVFHGPDLPGQLAAYCPCGPIQRRSTSRRRPARLASGFRWTVPA